MPYFFGIGGLEKIIQQRVQFLSEYFDILVFESDTKFDDKSGNFQGIKIVSVNYKAKSVIPIINYCILYKNILKTFAPDEVFVLDNGWKGLLIPYLSNKTKVSYERHGAVHFKNKKNILHFLKIKIYHLLALKFNRVFFLNPTMASSWPHHQKLVIPNGVTQNITPTYSKPKNILWVGRESTEKGLDNLFLIWENMYQKFPNWKLIIFTPLPIKNSNFKTNHSNQNIENIVGETDVFSIYKNGSILLNTSRYEGFGLTLLEAMSMELAVMSFDCEDGPKHLIENEINGYLIPENDLNNYVHKLSDLMLDDNIRIKIAKAGKLRSLEFDLKTMHQKWLDTIAKS